MIIDGFWCKIWLRILEIQFPIQIFICIRIKIKISNKSKKKKKTVFNILRLECTISCCISIAANYAVNSSLLCNTWKGSMEIDLRGKKCHQREKICAEIQSSNKEVDSTTNWCRGFRRWIVWWIGMKSQSIDCIWHIFKQKIKFPEIIPAWRQRKQRKVMKCKHSLIIAICHLWVLCKHIGGSGSGGKRQWLNCHQKLSSLVITNNFFFLYFMLLLFSVSTPTSSTASEN